MKGVYPQVESISFRVNQLVKHRFILNLSVLTYNFFFEATLNHSLCNQINKIYLLNRDFKLTQIFRCLSSKLHETLISDQHLYDLLKLQHVISVIHRKVAPSINTYKRPIASTDNPVNCAIVSTDTPDSFMARAILTFSSLIPSLTPLALLTSRVRANASLSTNPTL